MAVKATPKAMALLEQAKEEKGEALTKMETVAVAGPAYIPAIITGVSTIACIFGANVLNKRHQAALMSAYALLDNSYKEYKNKLGELYGEDVVEHVTEEVAKDKYEETDISVSEGKQLFYDEFSGRYFESTMAEVIQAAYTVNRKIALWGGVALNEYYEALDIPQVDYGEFLGWSAGGLMEMTWNDWLEFDYNKTLIDDDLECHIITFGVEPMYDYEYY
jgi:predicted lipase